MNCLVFSRLVPFHFCDKVIYFGVGVVLAYVEDTGVEEYGGGNISKNAELGLKCF